MSNSDLLGKTDKALRPVLKELGRFPWIRIEGGCAGHKQEDTLWIEINVLGLTGLNRLTELLGILDTKLAGTEIRVDCLLNHGSVAEEPPVAHGWVSTAVEIFWGPKQEWRRSQSMVVESLLSSIEDFRSRSRDTVKPEGAINFCPFCSSSFIRIDNIGAGDHKYRCGDCEMTWTMTDPVA
jgi:hypothetical protein